MSSITRRKLIQLGFEEDFILPGKFIHTEIPFGCRKHDDGTCTLYFEHDFREPERVWEYQLHIEQVESVLLESLFEQQLLVRQLERD